MTQLVVGYLALVSFPALVVFAWLTRGEWTEPEVSELDVRVDDFHSRCVAHWFGDEIEQGADWAWGRARVERDGVRRGFRDAA